MTNKDSLPCLVEVEDVRLKKHLNASVNSVLAMTSNHMTTQCT